MKASNLQQFLRHHLEFVRNNDLDRLGCRAESVCL